VPEIERFAGLSRRPIFVPSVGHFRQGMLVSIPLHLEDLPGRPAGADLRAVLERRYRGSEHVAVAAGGPGGKLEPQAPNDGDRLELFVWANDRCRQAVLVARLDNLGKGAAGAAVQNVRLMLDLDHAGSGAPGPH
jgi:N-acetyl-gamma-glutamyl-phosphate reductase